MLELKGITKEYKTGAETVHALRGIDLAFRESEFVSILGPSGCGKTTMLNILGGLDHYTEGDLIIDGISTKKYKDADWDAYRNDTIGFVFQSYNLISHQTVLSNVELALTLSGVSASERKQRAIAALEQVGLGDQISKKPAQMSGGQVQRVAIARALINDPDIILADEPTGALDSETSTQVMEILKDISRNRLVIMVTHNPDLAEEYSTRIVRLSDGEVISDSDPFVPAPDFDYAEGAAAAAAATAAAANAAGEDDDADDGYTPRHGGAEAAAAAIAASAPHADAGANSPANKSSAATAAGSPGANGGAVARAKKASGRARGRRNKSMSMATALHLSLNNLMTKKARTLLTAFAGSIGIIGIALILSVSHGFQTYIDKLEEDTLSSYPLTIQAETADMTSMIAAFMTNATDTEGEASGDRIHEQRIMTDMLASVGSNDLASFKKYVDANMDTIGEWFNAYDYSYGLTVNIYSTDLSYGPLRVSPGSIMQSYMSGYQQNNFSMMNTDVFFQMMDNEELLKSQYKVLAGRWPEKYDELLLVLDSEDQLNDYVVYTLGLRDPQELKDMINDVMNGKEVENNTKQLEWTYDDFLGMEFALIHSCDVYKRNSTYDVWEDMSDDDEFMEDLIKSSEKLRITGIVCAKEISAANAMNSGVGYLPSLTMHMIEYASESDIVKIQKENKNTDVFSGKSFESIRNKTDEGLGFEDMISIDEEKLREALGGKADPSAAKKQLEEIAKEALGDADPTDLIKKIMTEAGTNGGAMVKALLSQEPDKIYSVPFDNDTIDKVLGENLNKGKNRTIVNKLLKAYAEELKKKVPELQEQWAAQVAEIKAQIEANPMAAEMIAQQFGITADELTEALDNQEGKVSMGILSEVLPSSLTDYLKSDPAVNMVAAYAEAQALKKMGEALPEALAKTAEVAGSQFKVDPSGIAEAFTMKMDEDEITRLITAYVSGGQETNYENNLRKLGYADLAEPNSMSFYLKDFESKENFLRFIDEYNQKMQDAGKDDQVISYTDITGVMIKSVKNITNAVSYVLIAFVAISLIVSSIMIGVITYISVLERTKEIGILRAIGASKRDISRIFNAETIIVGLCAGLIGIGASLLLLIPINKLLIGLTKISALKAILPTSGAIALVIISMVLTFIAGLIPSGMAARRDPVEALRTE